jgi:hypothetical protein
MQYKKELIRELRDVAVLFHASHELPYKLLEVLDKHLPHVGDVCCERGCIEYEEPEREGMAINSIHSCHPECQRPICVLVREAVAAEREECADMADATGDPDLADAIRARGQS